MKLYLIRHAQSANNALWNGSDHVPGRAVDPDLIETGHRQCEALASHFVDPSAEPRQHPFQPSAHTSYGLTHLYCSLMARSITTAAYVARATGLPLRARLDVFERYGWYDLDQDNRMVGVAGPSRDELQGRFPELSLPDSLQGEGCWNRPAETDQQFLRRVSESVADLKRAHLGSNDRVAVVAHGDFIDQFINCVMGVERHLPNYDDNDWVANWTFHNTSVSRIDFQGGATTVVYLNRIDHLDGDLVTW